MIKQFIVNDTFTDAAADGSDRDETIIVRIGFIKTPAFVYWNRAGSTPVRGKVGEDDRKVNKYSKILMKQAWTIRYEKRRKIIGSNGRGGGER